VHRALDFRTQTQNNTTPRQPHASIAHSFAAIGAYAGAFPLILMLS
jgi:hypothetical protein